MLMNKLGFRENLLRDSQNTTIFQFIGNQNNSSQVRKCLRDGFQTTQFVSNTRDYYVYVHSWKKVRVCRHVDYKRNMVTYGDENLLLATSLSVPVFISGIFHQVIKLNRGCLMSVALFALHCDTCAI